jgi:hypothetical protein
VGRRVSYDLRRKKKFAASVAAEVCHRRHLSALPSKKLFPSENEFLANESILRRRVVPPKDVWPTRRPVDTIVSIVTKRRVGQMSFDQNTRNEI